MNVPVREIQLLARIIAKRVLCIVNVARACLSSDILLPQKMQGGGLQADGLVDPKNDTKEGVRKISKEAREGICGVYQ